MTTLHVATLRTPNFTFEAVAESPEQLEPALEIAWPMHADEHVGMRHELLCFDAVMEETERPGSGFELEVRALTSVASIATESFSQLRTRPRRLRRDLDCLAVLRHGSCHVAHRFGGMPIAQNKSLKTRRFAEGRAELVEVQRA